VVWSPPAAPDVEIIVHAQDTVMLRHCLDTLRFADLRDVAAIRVLGTDRTMDFDDVSRDFQSIWGALVKFELGTMPLAARLTASARSAGPPIVALLDARARNIASVSIEEVAGWVRGAPPIAWAAGIAMAAGDIVREAGRVACSDGTSAPLFRETPLRTWGWFGGSLWYRNASAASSTLFALRRADLAALDSPEAGLPFARWWTQACHALRGDGRRGLITPHARVWFDCDIEADPVVFDERFRMDPYFHPAFAGASPLRLIP
jgi:hypothetical protein